VRSQGSRSAPLAVRLSGLRFQLIKDGHLRPNVFDDLAGFHACQDPKPRRDAFVSTLQSHLDWSFASIVIEKNRVNATIQSPEKFYPKFLTMVLKFVLRGRVRQSTNQILIYTDTLPMQSKVQSHAVHTTIKSVCQQESAGKPFRVLHHSSESNYWLQIADYCSWSICRKWEFGETATYDLLRAKLAAPELAPMSSGDGTVYY
jgi:Protein of unknown function (DUF3800)